MPNIFLSNTGEYSNLSEKQILNNLSKYTVTQICAKVSEYFHLLRGRPKNSSRNYAALAHLANLAITHCKIDKKLPENLIDDNILTNLCQMVNSLEDKLFDKMNNEEGIYRYFLMKANSEFIYQFDLSDYEYAFSAYLFYNSRIRKYFENYFEMTIPLYTSLCFTLLTAFNDNGFTNLEKLLLNFKPEFRNEVKILLKKFSLTGKILKKLKKKNKRYINNDVDLFSFSILRDYPMYNIGDKYLLPIPGLLFNKLSDSIYYDIIQSFINKKQSPNNFTQEYGYALEDLINEIADLTINKDKAKCIKEFGVNKKGGELRSPDLTIIEDNWIFFVQVKNRRPPFSTHLGNIEEYKNNIKGSLIERYAQNLKVIRNKNAIYENKISNINQYKIISIIIYLGDYYMLNIDPVETYINTEINNLNHKYDELPFYNIFMSLYGFTNLLEFSLNTNRKMYKVIQDYMKYEKNPQKYNKNNNSIFKSDFSEWMYYKSKSAIKKQPFYRKYIQKIFDRESLTSKIIVPNAN